MSPRTVVAVLLAVGLGNAARAAPPVPRETPGGAPDSSVVGIPGPDGGAPPTLTLHDCIEAVLADNLELARERSHRQELNGQEWQAISTGLPSVDVTGTWSRSRDPSFLLDESFSTSGQDSLSVDLGGFDFLPDPDELRAQTFWRSSVHSEWELNPFRIINSLKAVDIRLHQHDQDLAATEHRIVEETMRTYHEVALNRENVAAVEAEVEERREFLDLTRRRFALELSTELDTLQAAVALANLEPRLRRARTDLRNAASRLNILMGRDAMTPLAIDPTVTVEHETIDRAAALDFALSRPDLRSLELQLEFLRKRRGVLRSDQRPYLSIDGTYGYVARSVEDLVDRQHDFWRANVSVNLPLFDGFLTRGRVEETEGTIRRTRQQLEEARRRARLEVGTALEELEAAHANLEAARLNMAAAESALAQMVLRYELGRAEYLDLLNAQSERFAARSNLIRARFDVLSQTATLKRALGIPPRTNLSHVRNVLEGTTP